MRALGWRYYWWRLVKWHLPTACLGAEGLLRQADEGCTLVSVGSDEGSSSRKRVKPIFTFAGRFMPYSCGSRLPVKEVNNPSGRFQVLLTHLSISLPSRLPLCRSNRRGGTVVARLHLDHLCLAPLLSDKKEGKPLVSFPAVSDFVWSTFSRTVRI